jgi:hypothetical protein
MILTIEIESVSIYSYSKDRGRCYYCSVESETEPCQYCMIQLPTRMKGVSVYRRTLQCVDVVGCDRRSWMCSRFIT